MNTDGWFTFQEPPVSPCGEVALSGLDVTMKHFSIHAQKRSSKTSIKKKIILIIMPCGGVFSPFAPICFSFFFIAEGFRVWQF